MTRALVGVTAFVLLSVIGVLLQAEATYRWNGLCRVVVRAAARRVSGPEGVRLQEEWTRHLEDLAAGPLASLAYACARYREARAITAERQLPCIPLAAKRALDLMFACIGFAAFWPLLLLVAVALKLEARGPLLTRQARVGRGGSWFRVYKFRTTRSRYEGDGASEYVTPLGALLQRSSLDQLPRLFNLLRGDMSLVGPRAVAPLAAVELLLANETRRFEVRPGLTGPAQLAAIEASDLGSWRARAGRFDSQYVEGWSFRRDLRLLARTVLASYPDNGPGVPR